MENSIVAGAIIVDNVTMINHAQKGINLKNVMVSLTLYEDLMSPFVSGELIISDASAIAELLPLIGEEMLIIDLETPNPSNDKLPHYKRHIEGFVYKMEGNEKITLKNNAIALCFASTESFTDVNTRISKTYKGKISDTVSTIVASDPGLKTAKSVVIENTANNEVHTSNFWTPSQNIYYLTSKALNRDNQPNYVFFENNEGFVFASLNTLYSAAPYAQFVRHNKVRKASEDRNIEEDYSTVIDMSTPTFYDYLERVQSGYYGSSLYHFDVHTKRLNYRNFITRDDIKTNRLNEFLPFSDQLQFRPEASLSMSVINRNLYNTSPTLTVDHSVRRMGHLSQLGSYVTNIEVFGRLDYAVGRVIAFTAYRNDPTNESDTESEIIDTVLSGNYLITALTHKITRESHICAMEISKDSLVSKIQ